MQDHHHEEDDREQRREPEANHGEPKEYGDRQATGAAIEVVRCESVRVSLLTLTPAKTSRPHRRAILKHHDEKTVHPLKLFVRQFLERSGGMAGCRQAHINLLIGRLPARRDNPMHSRIICVRDFIRCPALDGHTPRGWSQPVAMPPRLVAPPPSVQFPASSCRNSERPARSTKARGGYVPSAT